MEFYFYIEVISGSFEDKFRKRICNSKFLLQAVSLFNIVILFKAKELFDAPHPRFLKSPLEVQFRCRCVNGAPEGVYGVFFNGR